jgi:3',5'-cyclic AMP phosphodiesterase CpdA
MGTAALGRALGHLAELRPRPDAAFITGDLADRGEPEAYRAMAGLLEGLPFPAYVIPGNHDDKRELLAALGPWCPAGPELLPEICYSVRVGPVLAVALDTAMEGSHSGGVSEKACRWLANELSRNRGAPALVFCHHPPFESGMGLMDTPFINDDWLASALREDPAVLLCCGHLHAGMALVWRGIRAVAAPPVSMDMVLELTQSGGGAYTVGTPGYSIHSLGPEGMLSHFRAVPWGWPLEKPSSFKELYGADRPSAANGRAGE